MERVQIGGGLVQVASGSFTFYNDSGPTALLMGSLKQRGFRQLTLTMNNTAALTLILQNKVQPNTAFQNYNSTAVAAFDVNNPNTFAWDLTALGDIALVGSSAVAQDFCWRLEASRAVETLGCQ